MTDVECNGVRKKNVSFSMMAKEFQVSKFDFLNLNQEILYICLDLGFLPGFQMCYRYPVIVVRKCIIY